MIRRIIFAITLLTTALVAPLPAQAPTQRGHTGLSLDLITAKWTGDFDGMLERRIIRVLTAYNKTLYFIDRGTERGMSADGVDRVTQVDRVSQVDRVDRVARAVAQWWAPAGR